MLKNYKDVRLPELRHVQQAAVLSAFRHIFSILEKKMPSSKKTDLKKPLTSSFLEQDVQEYKVELDKIRRYILNPNTENMLTRGFEELVIATVNLCQSASEADLFLTCLANAAVEYDLPDYFLDAVIATQDYLRTIHELQIYTDPSSLPQSMRVPRCTKAPEPDIT